MAIKPKLTLEDYGGDQEKLNIGQAALDAAWSRANPEGTLVQSAVMPQITFDDVGGVKNWGEHDRIIRNAYYNANGTDNNPTGINRQVAEGLANGTLTDKDAQSNYGALAANKMDELNAMGQFNYDFNKDPLFKILSNSYMQQAKRAAADVSANAAMRTGGYGNSYGAAAAGQQYNDALGNLYDQVPELQEAAYNRYLNDRSDLYKQAGYYNDLAGQYYDRDWQQKQWDYAVDQDRLDREWQQKQFDYNAEQDQKAWDWQQKEWDYKVEQAEKDRALEEAQYASSLGNYDLAAELLGTSFASAQAADDINLLTALVPLMGYDQAINVLEAMRQRSAQSAAQGAAAGATGSGAGGEQAGAQQEAEQIQITPVMASTGRYPDISAGTGKFNGQNVILPPTTTALGDVRYETSGGRLYYKVVDPDGTIIYQGEYTGPLMSVAGDLIREGSGSSIIPYPIISEPTKTTGGATAAAAANNGAAASTGSPLLDAIKSFQQIDPALQAAAERASGYARDDGTGRSFIRSNDYYNSDGYEDWNGSRSSGYSGRSGSSGGSGRSGGGYSGGYSGSNYSYSGSGSSKPEEKTETKTAPASTTKTNSIQEISKDEWRKIFG